MGKSIGFLIVLIGLAMLISIVWMPFEVNPNLAKTIMGIIFIMFGIIEIKERRFG